MYTLDCPYYNKQFTTLDELITDVMVSGMDPNYTILHDGVSMNEELADHIVM